MAVDPVQVGRSLDRSCPNREAAREIFLIAALDSQGIAGRDRTARSHLTPVGELQTIGLHESRQG